MKIAKPTNPLILEALGAFEVLRRLGASPDHIHFAAHAETGVGLLVGTTFVQLSDTCTDAEALCDMWTSAARWWNGPPDGQYNLYRAFHERVIDQPEHLLALHRAVKSCPVGDA
jgi:hypothetical protein